MIFFYLCVLFFISIVILDDNIVRPEGVLSQRPKLFYFLKKICLLNTASKLYI